MDSNEARQSKRDAENQSPSIWSSLSILAVTITAGVILARVECGSKLRLAAADVGDGADGSGFDARPGR